MVLFFFAVACACLASLLFCSSKSSSKSKRSADKVGPTATSPGKETKTTPTERKGDAKMSSKKVVSKQPVHETKPSAPPGNETTENKKKEDKPEGDKGANIDDELKFGELVDDEEPRTNFDSIDENENPFSNNQLQEKLKNGRKKRSQGTVRAKKSKPENTKKAVKPAKDSPEQAPQSTKPSAASKPQSNEETPKTKPTKPSTESKNSNENGKQSTKLDAKT